MNKNTNPELLLLIGLAALIFLLASVGLFLLQDPTAPLPWAAAASNTPTSIPQMSPTRTQLSTQTPVIMTSYTPFATRLVTDTGTVLPSPTGSLTAAVPTSITSSPIISTTPSPTFTPGTPPATSPSSTLTPSITPTLGPGEFGLTGRVVQDGTPVSGVLVTFTDDLPARISVTNSDGNYWFITLAVGASFTVTFELEENLQLDPSMPVAETVLLQGFLPSGSPVITLPDLDINTLIDGQSFEPTIPADGAARDTDNITPLNPIQFTWTTYIQADYYFVELRSSDKDESQWISEKTIFTNVIFDGELDDGTHIGPDSYNWFAVASRPIGAYRLTVFAQPRSLVIDP